MIIFLELRPWRASSTYSHSQPLTLPTPAASTALVHPSASQLTNTENGQIIILICTKLDNKKKNRKNSTYLNHYQALAALSVYPAGK